MAVLIRYELFSTLLWSCWYGLGHVMPQWCLAYKLNTYLPSSNKNKNHICRNAFYNEMWLDLFGDITFAWELLWNILEKLASPLQSIAIQIHTLLKYLLRIYSNTSLTLALGLRPTIYIIYEWALMQHDRWRLCALAPSLRKFFVFSRLKSNKRIRWLYVPHNHPDTLRFNEF